MCTFQTTPPRLSRRKEKERFFLSTSFLLKYGITQKKSQREQTRPPGQELKLCLVSVPRTVPAFYACMIIYRNVTVFQRDGLGWQDEWTRTGRAENSPEFFPPSPLERAVPVLLPSREQPVPSPCWCRWQALRGPGRSPLRNGRRCLRAGRGT